MSDLDYLSDEQVEDIKQIFPKVPKEDKELQSTDESEQSKTVPIEKESVEVDKKPKVEDWKDGYEEYEKKTKQSSGISYLEDEIEVIEEDM